MSTKALVAILIAAAILIGGVLAMHGKGHRLLARWMPAIHGGH
jgi:preprotein translocase subunit SecG